MAKITGKVLPSTIRAFRGRVDVYHHKWAGWVARQWPKPHRPCLSPAWQQTRDNLSRSWQLYHEASPEQILQWKDLARSSGGSYVDVMRASVMGCPPGQFSVLNAASISVASFTPTSVTVNLYKPPAVIGTTADGDYTYTIFSAATPAGKLPTSTPKPRPLCPTSARRLPGFGPAPPGASVSTATNVFGSPSLQATMPLAPGQTTVYFMVLGLSTRGCRRPITGDIALPIPTSRIGWYTFLYSYWFSASACIDPPDLSINLGTYVYSDEFYDWLLTCHWMEDMYALGTCQWRCGPYGSWEEWYEACWPH